MPAMAGPRLVTLLAAAACVAACSKSNSPTSDYGIDRRVEVAPLALPTGLPQPIPVTWQNAFPSLVFDRPVFVGAPPDGSDRLVVAEQTGRLRVFANDAAVASSTVMLDLSADVLFGGEQGLLGVAFHPDFASNGFVYLYRTKDAPRRSVLSRFTISADPDVLDPASELVLLEVEQPFTNHNAGSLAFGPDDKLYVALGDGGAGNDPNDNGQNLSTLLGSVLRLDDDGTPPADNPFVGVAGARPEIWAYGLRNPWRMSFDPATGDLWLGDVGQGAREEIDRIERGGNYGWRVFEGNRANINPDELPASAFTAPVFDYDRTQGYSVTGGLVYRGAAVPTLQGSYIYGDFGSGRVWALVFDGVQAVGNVQIGTLPSAASFGEDRDGELYACCFDGALRRLQADPTPQPSGDLPSLLSQTGLFTDTATLTPSPGILEYDVQMPLWSDGAEKRRWIALPGTARMQFHPTDAWTFPIGTALVKHFEIATTTGTSRLETRVLLHQRTGWLGFSYRWNAQQTDASLVADGGETFAFDGSRQWTIPSRAACLQCHTQAAGRVLGVRTRQLNRTFAFPLQDDNQLRTWNHLGLFATDIGEASQYEAFAAPDAAEVDVSALARAYLDSNCSQCHRPLGPTPVDLDLRSDVAAAAMQLFGVTATTPLPGGSGLRGVAGDHTQSELWLRMQRRDAFGMPPLGSHVVDDVASQWIAQWIDGDPTGN